MYCQAGNISVKTSGFRLSAVNAFQLPVFGEKTDSCHYKV